MTALADLSPYVEIPSAGIADKAVSSRATAFDAQVAYGATNDWVVFTGNVATHVTRSAQPSDFLDINYTPAVDSWWEVEAMLGQIEKQENTAHYTAGYLVCQPAPVNSAAQLRYQLSNQKFGNGRFGFRSVHALWALQGGVAYRAEVWLGGGNGGTWTYARHPYYQQLHGKGWAR